MTLSDALPVQFWLNDCETFNQKIVDGINQVCFCQPFNCDDEIRIQFTDSVEQSDINEFSLSVFNDEEIEIVNLATSVNSIYQRLESDPLNTFSNYGSGGVAWTSLASIPHVDLAFAGSPSKELRFGLLNGEANKIARIIFNHTTTKTGGSFLICNWSVTLYNEDFSQSISDSGAISLGTHTQVAELTPTFVPIWATLSAGPILAFAGNASQCHIDINSFAPDSDSYYSAYSIYSVSFIPSDNDICDENVQIKILDNSTTPETVVAYSDCISIKDDHDETVLINYSNHRSFAGLDYSDISPDPDFNIRIPAIFFQERFPQEQEVIELSDNREIQLNSQIKVERFLETGPMPFYMHKKLIEILMQQFVIIDGMYWVKGNAYEIKENSNKRYPLRMGNIWLTQQDYIARNIL